MPTKKSQLTCERCRRSLDRECFDSRPRPGNGMRMAKQCRDCMSRSADRPTAPASDQPCACGCGQFTRIAQRTNPKWGHIRGMPQQYVVGHSPRVTSGQMWRVEDGTGCWIWLRSKDKSNRGQVAIRDKINPQLNRHTSAHRWNYETHIGPIPEGLELDHLCANGLCVNPAHLEPVTHQENMRRNVARLRFAGRHWIKTGEVL
jgi:hypothetical protein